uniref:Uncharacterized protein n=1 Tax=Vespula pensylvanica TaxID=30213 RepID=A0A834P0N2_VESPE|nr:hypothetical protein H0235_008852 [Vespula pensylvanica]
MWKLGSKLFVELNSLRSELANISTGLQSEAICGALKRTPSSFGIFVWFEQASFLSASIRFNVIIEFLFEISMLSNYEPGSLPS